MLQRKTRALLVANKETRLEVNADKTKYIVMSWDQNAERNHNMKIDDSSFERAEQFRYLRTTWINQNSIQEEIKSRLKSRNACYHSVQNLLPSSLLSENIKIMIYGIIMLPAVLYGCKSWSRTLFEGRVLRRIFRLKRDEVSWEWRKIHNEELNPFPVQFKSLVPGQKSRVFSRDI